MFPLHDRTRQRYVSIPLTHNQSVPQSTTHSSIVNNDNNRNTKCDNSKLHKWHAFGHPHVAPEKGPAPLLPVSERVEFLIADDTSEDETTATKAFVDEGDGKNLNKSNEVENKDAKSGSDALAAVRERLLTLSARVAEAKTEQSAAPTRREALNKRNYRKRPKSAESDSKPKAKPKTRSKKDTDTTDKSAAGADATTTTPDDAATEVPKKRTRKTAAAKRAAEEQSRRTLFTMPPENSNTPRAKLNVTFKEVENGANLFLEIQRALHDPNRIQAPVLFVGFLTREGESNFSISASTHGKVHFVRGVNPEQCHLALQSVTVRWGDEITVLPAATALSLLVRIAEELPGVELITFNAPSLLLLLLSYKQGNLFTSCVSDVRIMAWMLQPSGGADAFADYDALLQSWHHQIGLSPSFQNAESNSVQEVVCHRVFYMVPLYRALYGQLGAQGLLPAFLKQEKRVSLLCSIMKLNGFYVNISEVDGFKSRCLSRMETLRVEAQRLVPSIQNLNLQSHEQCREAIYEVLLLGRHLSHVEADGSMASSLTITKGGRLSTSEETLRLLTPHHELPRVVIAYRKAAKLLQTYTEGLMETAIPVQDEQDGEFADQCIRDTSTSSVENTTVHGVQKVKLVKLHANFVQEGTDTGRLSCVEPNLQNLPRPTRKTINNKVNTQNKNAEAGTSTSSTTVNGVGITVTNRSTPTLTTIGTSANEVTERNESDLGSGSDPLCEDDWADMASFRRCFVPPPGWMLLSVDYEQIELRVLAHLCADATLVTALTNATDIHRAIAEAIFRKSPVSDEERSLAKRVVFGIVYGAGPRTLATQMGVDVEEAVRISTLFKSTYPQMDQYHRRVIEQCRTDGFVRTLSGRIRNLPDINDTVIAKRAYAERQAFNTVIQGSAADVMKLGMLAVEREVLQPRGKDARLLAQIHDEIVLTVPTAALREVVPLVSHSMTHAVSLLVPLRVTVKVGRSLAEMGEWTLEHELGIREFT